MTFEDYLVQLTWANSPQTEGGKYEIEARKQQIELAKKDWTRNLSAGFNFNDVSYPYFLVNTLGVKKYFGNTIDLTKLPTVATNPLWQVAVGVNFGDLYVRKNKVKYAESNQKISEAELNLAPAAGEVIATFGAVRSGGGLVAKFTCNERPGDMVKVSAALALELPPDHEVKIVLAPGTAVTV